MEIFLNIFWKFFEYFWEFFEKLFEKVFPPRKKNPGYAHVWSWYRLAEALSLPSTIPVHYNRLNTCTFVEIKITSSLMPYIYLWRSAFMTINRIYWHGYGCWWNTCKGRLNSTILQYFTLDFLLKAVQEIEVNRHTNLVYKKLQFKLNSAKKFITYIGCKT